MGGVVSVIDPVGQFQKARDARRKSDLSQIQKALETYYNDIGQYPESSADYKIKANATTTLNWGSTGWQYMAALPKDPSVSLNYVYYSPTTPAVRQSYYLYANLERGTKDSQACSGGNVCPSATANGVGTKCGVPSAKCNYGVTSPNVSL